MISAFVQSVLLPTNIIDDDEAEPGVLPETASITRIEDLLDQMKFREVPKRALFSVPFEIAENFVVGVKGHVPSCAFWATLIVSGHQVRPSHGTEEGILQVFC